MSEQSLTGRYELHCHLDCSVRLATIAELAGDLGLHLDRPVRQLAVAPPDVGSLHGFLRHVDVQIAVLQSQAALRRAAGELVEDWHRDGVVHGEVRFAPQLHTRTGLGVDEVIAAVAEGLRAGAARYRVRTALIVCCLRHQPVQTSVEVAEAAVRNRHVVAGLDLAGDERLPGAAHAPAFALAHAAGLPVTVHAGEAAGPESVWEAIDVLGAQRIGHGVRSTADETLLRRLERDRIALEMCPRCNVLTGAVPTLDAHPADRLLERGLAVTISTDARTTADTSLDVEFAALATTFDWGRAEHDEVQAHARRAAFSACGPPGGARPPG